MYFINNQFYIYFNSKLNKKKNYTYPHLYNYECIKNCKYYPSIFYYIYKKRINRRFTCYADKCPKV